MKKTMYHVTGARNLDRIMDSGLRPGSGDHSEHVYLFDEPDAALSYAQRYHLTPQQLGNGISIGGGGQPLLLFVEGDGLELEPDPMRPLLPHAFRTTDPIEPERVIATSMLSFDGTVLRTSRPRRLA